MKLPSLKTKFTRTIFFAFIIFGSLIYLSFHVVTRNVIDHLGINFAAKEALLSKSKLMSAIQGDLSLSRNMARSPALIRWVQDENNENSKGLALQELENYRKSFYGRSIFLIIDKSKNYYFDDDDKESGFNKARYSLEENNLNDSWYFRTMREVDDFELNVDFNNQINATKIWFNVVLRNKKNDKIGICGGAIDITKFIDNLVNSGEEGIENILFREDGAITASRQKSYVFHNSKVRGNDNMATIYSMVETTMDKENLDNAITSLSASDKEVETLNLNINGKSYLAALSHSKKINWFNLVLVDPENFVNYHDFIPILAVIISSILAILAILGFMLNRLVLAPLADLAESSHVVAGGNFDNQIQVRSEDEIGSLARSFNSMTRMVKDYTENLEFKVRKRTEELDRSNQKLAESNHEIMDSIRFARSIQTSILPEDSTVREFTADFFALYRPREIIGGDFYYFRKVRGGCFIAVADCTGHGVAGAIMTMTAKAVLDRVLDDRGDENPGPILKEYNRLIRTTLHKGDDNLLDNGLEIGLCRIDPNKRSMVFAGARIDLHYHQENSLRVIDGDKQAVGYRRSDVDFNYTDYDVQLEEDMVFYMVSDGILDHAGGPRGWGFGKKRLRELLEDIHRLPLTEQKGDIEKALARYQGDVPQRDDITVIGFRF